MSTLTPAILPRAARPRPLPPVRRNSVADLPAHDLTILEMVRGLTLSQWLVLLYPIFLLVVHRKRDEGDVAGIDGSAVLQIALTGVCGIWVLHRLLAALKAFERLILATPLRWLLAYAILAILSASWASMPSLTVYRGLQIAIFLVLVVDAMASFNDVQAMLKFQLLFAAGVVMFWQLAMLRLSVSIDALHTSDVAGTISVIVFAGVLVRGKQWRMVHLGLCAAMLLSTSTGAVFACIGGLIVTLLMMRGRASGAGLFLLCAMIVTPLLFPDTISSMVFFGKNETAVRTGTGRLPIWQWVLEERVSQAPILGFGFGEGEVQARLFNIGGFRMMHMHNAFMSAIVNLGIVGVALWAAMWADMARAALKIPIHWPRIVLMGAAATLFLNTISVESVTAPLTMPWLAHAMFFALLAIGRWPEGSS